MHSLITSYLLQTRECVLPGIGILKIINTPASTDSANNLLLPPFEEIIFKAESHTKSFGLIKYIADKKHIEQSEAENILNNFCNEWKERINAGEKLTFETVGSIQKNADGVITFEGENRFGFLQPIVIDKAYRREKEPEAIIEDPVVPEQNIFEEEEVIVERSYWGLWALILLAIGSVMLFYHFKDHKLSGTTVGNQHNYSVDSATATYNISK